MDEPAWLRPPPPDLFARRARRALTLAAGHDLGDLLRFAAALAQRQQTALEQGQTRALPPLARALAQGLLEDPDLQLPAPARAALERIRAASDDWLETQGRALPPADDGPDSDLDPDGIPDLACAPVIGAALQVLWTARALALDPTRASPETPPDSVTARCPVCAAPPLASVLRAGGGTEGVRYLHCGRCGGEWRQTRSQCSQCGNGRDIAYLNVAGAGTRIQAETCPECRAYLKICRLDQDPETDPWADDLATLALDWLVDAEGFERAGMNFLLLHRSLAS